MRLRTRLLIAFAYILLAVVIALEVPFAITLERRAVSEERTRSVSQAQAVADAIEVANLMAAGEEELQRFVENLSEVGRVIVTNGRGMLLADSAGTGLVGQSYLGRPEIDAVVVEGEQVGQEIRFSEDVDPPQEILVTAAAVHRGERRVGVVRLTHSLEAVRTEVRRIVAGLAAVGVAGLIAGLGIAWFLAGSLSRPLTRLAGAAHRLGEGDLSARSGVRTGGEIGEVAETFDAMAERLEATVRAQREFVANASHQLRTPLTGLKLRLEGAGDDAPTDELRTSIRAAEREADRLAGIVERLLVLARRVEEGAVPAHTDLAELAQDVAARWEDRARERGGSITVDGAPDGLGTWVAAAREDVEQIVDNLVDNALSYAPGPVRIVVGERDGHGVVTVEDRGRGIPPEEREKVFERFYRGRTAPAGGSGLGLTIVRELAARWDGDVAIVDGPDGGTRFEVRLPSLTSS